MQDELLDVVTKLKGISCALSKEAMCDENSVFEWNAEEKMLLNSTLKECIEELVSM